MDALVTGAGGLLGRTVSELLRRRGMDVGAFGRDRLDVTDPSAVRSALEGSRPRAVVHCAAMTDVDACESQAQRAHAVNAQGAGMVAAEAAAVGAEIVAISTDYVFDGRKGGPYTEGDEPNPIQIYGRTKLEGEEAVRDANPRHYVVRSAWIYGPGGRNFLSRLPVLVAQGEPIRAVTDQRGSPTSAPDLAEAIAGMLGSGRHGTYHVVNEGSCSFAEFCGFALERLGVRARVEETTVAALGRPAPRPADTSLVGEAWANAGFAALRGWRDAASEFVRATA